MFCKHFFFVIIINIFCNRRDQRRKGVWFSQLDPVLPSREKRTVELLQPQLRWTCKHPIWFMLNMLIYTVMCSTPFRFCLSFFHLLSVDYLPWCHGDAVHVGRLLQAGRFCSHWLQPWIWLCLIQPLLHHSPWETVSTSRCPVMLSYMWIFSDWDLLLPLIHRCRLSLGGKQLIIQTYTWDNSFYGDKKKFIASAYPATPTN